MYISQIGAGLLDHHIICAHNASKDEFHHLSNQTLIYDNADRFTKVNTVNTHAEVIRSFLMDASARSNFFCASQRATFLYHDNVNC